VLPNGAVVYVKAGALAGEPQFTYDDAGNNLAVANDTDTGGVYRIGGGSVVRVDPPRDNTFLGLSGNATVTGTANTAAGEGALMTATANFQNTAVGYRALSLAQGASNPQGSYNTATGYLALEKTTTGFANSAFGTLALNANVLGFFNTAVGAGSLAALNGAAAASNTAVGYSALTAATTTTDNTAVGANALSSVATVNGLTAIGSNALRANTTGVDNTAVGGSALTANTTGTRNVALGNAALASNTTGGDNTGLGVFSLNLTTGSQNTGVGASALQANTTGFENAVLGSYALDSANNPSYNVAIGSNAMSAATGGPDRNTAVGANALQNASSFRNTAIGMQAGTQLTTGAGNTFLGYQAGSALTGAESNNIMIGHTGNAGENNMIRLGTNGVQTDTRIAGIFGTAIAAPVAVFINANGQLGTVSSSERTKENILDMGARSEQLLRLRPVVFRYRPEFAAPDDPRPERYGLIAEEVAAVNPDWVAHNTDGSIATVEYDQVNAALLGLVQRQQQQIDTLTQQMKELARKLSELERSRAKH
jgi:hypothetical protein